MSYTKEQHRKGIPETYIARGGGTWEERGTPSPLERSDETRWPTPLEAAKDVMAEARAGGCGKGGRTPEHAAMAGRQGGRGEPSATSEVGVPYTKRERG